MTKYSGEVDDSKYMPALNSGGSRGGRVVWRKRETNEFDEFADTAEAAVEQEALREKAL